jgi:hypothetical protein
MGKTPEHIKARNKEWYRKNKKKVYDLNKRNRTSKPDQYKASGRRTRLKRTYSITPEAVDSMLKEQGSGCAICGTRDFGPRGSNIDHCHETGKVRGLLCINCNQALGKFKDDTSLLKKAIEYLENHPKD